MTAALDEARAFGMDERSRQLLRAAMVDPADDGEGVWPENVAIVRAFLAVDSQWRTVAVGGGLAPGHVLFIGLDYSAARVGLDALGIDVTPELWRGLRIMESAASRALNEANR